MVVETLKKLGVNFKAKIVKNKMAPRLKCEISRDF